MTHEREHMSSAVAGSGVAAAKALADESAAPEKRPFARTQTSVLLRPAKEAYGVVEATELAKPYDVVVIGGGPAGVAAAQSAAFLGRRALLVDGAPCAPNELDLTFGAPTGLFSKALRDTAKSLDVGLLSRMGLDAKVVWAQVQASVARLAANNARTQLSTLQDFKVHYLRSTARLDGGEGIVATDIDGKETKVSSPRVLIATGSLPTRPDSVPFDDVRVFDSDSIAKLQFLPRSVVIAGAGIIAIEYAKIFAKLQCSVTMLVRSEASSSLARIGLDPDIAQALLDDLKDNGVTVLTHTSTTAFDVPSDLEQPMTVSLKGGKEGVPPPPPTLECDIFLAAMGRRPCAERCGVAEVGGVVDPKSGVIKVDANFHVEGAPAGVFAAGDVIGPPSLASTGVEQAKLAVSAMFEEDEEGKATVGRDNFPVGVWTIPEIGYYGLSKEGAAKKGIVAEEGKAPYTACLRGRVFAPQGFLKLVFDRADGRIIGVHIFGTDACELIHFGMELVNSRRSIFDVMSMLFTAVTFHELFKFAALDANSKLQFGKQWQSVLKALNAVGMSKDDLEGLRAKFNELDTNGNGQLDAEELSAVFKAVGREVSLGMLTNMLRLADEDGSGSISFDEFAAIIAAL
jgi:NAD(P) transhydrogenase